MSGTASGSLCVSDNRLLSAKYKLCASLSDVRRCSASQLCARTMTCNESASVVPEAALWRWHWLRARFCTAQPWPNMTSSNLAQVGLAMCRSNPAIRCNTLQEFELTTHQCVNPMSLTAGPSPSTVAGCGFPVVHALIHMHVTPLDTTPMLSSRCAHGSSLVVDGTHPRRRAPAVCPQRPAAAAHFHGSRICSLWICI